jgi:hypothetical protein
MLSNKRFSLLVAALLMGTVPAMASDVVSTINELPAIEIPAKAASAVRAAPAEKQLELSRQILTAVLKERPQMAVQMVATLSRISPDSAPVLAVIASSIVPQYGDVILRAAAASAPAQADLIAATSALFFPESQDLVVKAVSEGAPQAAASVSEVVNSLPQRFTSSPVANHSAAVGTVVKTIKESIVAASPVTKTVDPVTGNQVAVTPKGLQQLVEKVEAAVEAAKTDATAPQISATAVLTLKILEQVVTIKQEAAKNDTDQDEGFGSVAETEQFVEGDVAVDEQRNDPIIKAKLEAAKEEFIENKYNQ